MIDRRGTRPLLPPGTEALRPFVDAGVLDAAPVHVAAAIARTIPTTSDDVLLAAALAVRATLLGHVCVELARAATLVTAAPGGDESADDQGDDGDDRSALPWPTLERWAAALRMSDAVVVPGADGGGAPRPAAGADVRPLVWDGRRVYLERYWRYERAVGDDLARRVTTATTATTTSAGLEAALDRFFGPADPLEPDLQRRAAAAALTRSLAVVAGGPGTGKTRTVARLLAAAHQLAQDEGRTLQVALAAPTGKAAARMTEAVHRAVAEAALPPALTASVLAAEASTLHRLLGVRDDVRFRHDHADPLPHDLVVVDETSMVALPLMARLLDALRPDARIVLVGDPNQLASVEAGAVLGDLVGPAAASAGEPPAGPLAPAIVVLRRVHRFAADSAIAVLADAVRTGDADRALAALRDADDAEARRIDPSDPRALRELHAEVAANAAAVAGAALAGDGEAGLHLATEVKVLCATRYGPLGSTAWTSEIERAAARLVDDLAVAREWYVGRPIIVTRNDYLTGVFNGDTGLVVRRAGRPTVAFPSADGLRHLAPSQLDAVETWWAMTIHKSQGSEFAHAVVSLPSGGSGILTRELLYTGITRAKQRVSIVADEQTLRTAIARPIARASGLRDRFWPTS